MICEDIGDFLAALPPMQSIAGLDLGTRTIGVAVSDTFLSVASPLETIRRGKFSQDAARLAEIAAQRRIGGLVLGLPRNMDGSEGPRCQSTRAFARNLEKLDAINLPVTFWDERLSTVAAERALLEADTSRKRRAEVIDHVAAAYILQGVLDRIRVLRIEQEHE
jgi:putative holliday junction resolvase